MALRPSGLHQWLTLLLVISVLGLGGSTWLLYEETLEQEEQLAGIQADLTDLEFSIVELETSVLDALEAAVNRLTRIDRDVSNLASRVDEVERTQAPNLSAAIGSLDSRMFQAERDVSSVERRVSDIEGFFWNPITNRNLAQLDDCLDDILWYLQYGGFLFC